MNEFGSGELSPFGQYVYKSNFVLCSVGRGHGLVVMISDFQIRIPGSNPSEGIRAGNAPDLKCSTVTLFASHWQSSDLKDRLR